MKDFKEFLLRGNLVDVAVGIVIGVAFAALVTAFVADLITPLLAAIGGKPNFDNLSFTINSSHFLYGAFINALISFLIIAAVIFFLVVKPVNALMARRRTETPVGRADARVPRVSQRDPGDGAALRVLHVGGRSRLSSRVPR
jgi:large conductance mechanosensitive channel